MSRKKVQDYLTGPYSRILIHNEDNTFSAEVMEFPGCFAEGATQEEALNNLDRAAEEWIESSLRNHREIAEPFSVRGFSGAVSLRLPKGLHRQAARMAEREGTSLNQYIATALAVRVGAEDILHRLSVQTHFFANIQVVNQVSNSVSLTITMPTANIGQVVASSVQLVAPAWGTTAPKALGASNA